MPARLHAPAGAYYIYSMHMHIQVIMGMIAAQHTCLCLML